MAKFCGEVNSRIFEIYKQKGLVFVFYIDLVLLFDVSNHADNLGWLIGSVDGE
jgi:hypothetical protein